MAKSVLKKISGGCYAVLRTLLDKRGFRIARFEHIDFFEPLLYRRLLKSPNFFFVQIGANDGIMCDPIRNFVTRNKVAGLAVEPLKDMFEKLRANYRDYPKIKPVNVAIHATEKSFTLHRVDPAKVARFGIYTQGTGSFHKRHHTSNRIPEDALLAETVNCMTLSELFEQNNIHTLDLLQIDTEGYDAEILKLIDFNRYKPAIIRFEHGLPEGTMSLDVFKDCVQRLIDQGYYVVTEPYDAVAYQPELI